MAYNTKDILRDAGTKPIPQYFNEELDRYEPLEGKNGANKSFLVGTDGTPLMTESKPAYITNAREIYGATIDERPDPTTVAIGTVFILANTDLDAWISNGTEWVVI